MGSDSERAIAVAFCPNCDENVPVIQKEINMAELFSDLFNITAPILVIYCPVCDNMLNNGKDVELTYYSLSDIDKVTNFRVGEPLDGTAGELN